MIHMYNESDYIRLHQLRPCDRIVVPKSNMRLVQHHAVYLGNDDFGNHWISENVIGRGVVLTRVKDFFAANRTITRIERFQGTGYERKVAVQRALERLGRPYSLINYNCEHFANDVLKRRPQSSQVGNAFAIAGVALLIGLLLGGD